MEGKDWRRTRRNILSMGAVLVGVAFSGCKAQDPERDRVFDWELDREGRHRYRDDPDGCGRMANCYLEGTHIRTTRGERKIEDLRIGEFFITIGGGAQPIEWIGRRRYRRARRQRGDDAGY